MFFRKDPPEACGSSRPCPCCRPAPDTPFIMCQLYRIPRVGGWDVLSQLLNASPLIHNQHPSPAFKSGDLFQLHGMQAVGRKEQAQLDYLLQLIDRCSVMVTLWPYIDQNGKHAFGSLNLVRHIDRQTGWSSSTCFSSARTCGLAAHAPNCDFNCPFVTEILRICLGHACAGA